MPDEPDTDILLCGLQTVWVATAFGEGHFGCEIGQLVVLRGIRCGAEGIFCKHVHERLKNVTSLLIKADV